MVAGECRPQDVPLAGLRHKPTSGERCVAAALRRTPRSRPMFASLLIVGAWGLSRPRNWSIKPFNAGPTAEIDTPRLGLV